MGYTVSNTGRDSHDDGASVTVPYHFIKITETRVNMSCQQFPSVIIIQVTSIVTSQINADSFVYFSLLLT